MNEPDPILEGLRRRATEAGIALSEEDLARLKQRYAQMMDQLRTLRELDLSGVEPLLAFQAPVPLNREAL